MRIYKKIGCRSGLRSFAPTCRQQSRTLGLWILEVIGLLYFLIWDPYELHLQLLHPWGSLHIQSTINFRCEADSSLTGQILAEIRKNNLVSWKHGILHEFSPCLCFLPWLLPFSHYWWVGAEGSRSLDPTAARQQGPWHVGHQLGRDLGEVDCLGRICCCTWHMVHMIYVFSVCIFGA